MVVIKDLEKMYRGDNYSMVPVCPKCGEALDLKELVSWKNRKFLKPEN
nr:MAG TPA: zinc-ribbon domain protein [Caudoviricetes sp.]